MSILSLFSIICGFDTKFELFSSAFEMLALTHLPELVVDQPQPGHVQVVQVVAAVALRGRRRGALLVLPVAGHAGRQLWEQPAANTHRQTGKVYSAVGKQTPRLTNTS